MTPFKFHIHASMDRSSPIHYDRMARIAFNASQSQAGILFIFCVAQSLATVRASLVHCTYCSKKSYNVKNEQQQQQQQNSLSLSPFLGYFLVGFHCVSIPKSVGSTHRKKEEKNRDKLTIWDDEAGGIREKIFTGLLTYSLYFSLQFYSQPVVRFCADLCCTWKCVKTTA